LILRSLPSASEGNACQLPSALRPIAELLHIPRRRELLRKSVLLDALRRAARKAGDEIDEARDLVIGELALAPLDQRERLQRLPVSELPDRPDVLFTHLARDANHGRLLDARMRVDDALDLPGRDVLAAAAQRVLLAAAIVKVTVLVGVAEVAG